MTFQLNPDISDTKSNVEAYIYLVQLDGTVIKKESLATDKENLNINELDKHVHLVYSPSKEFLGLHMVRLMTESSDGLNH